MATLSPRRVLTANGPIEVAEVGEGPALLVVHGIPGDWRQARTVAADLGGQSRVLLVSRPGYGRTPLGANRTPGEQARLYAALLDELGIGRAVVLGISGGGPSSYAFAAAYPQRCQGLLLCCALTPHLLRPPGVMVALAAVPGVWRAVAAAGRAAGRQSREQGVELAGLTAVERVLAADAQVDEDLRRFANERASTLRGSGLRNDTRQIAARREIAWPVGVQVPTVILHGDSDEVVPMSHAVAFQSAIPAARLERLPGYGHALPLFARTLLADRLRDLLVPRAEDD